MYRGTYDGWGYSPSGSDQDYKRQEAGASVEFVHGSGRRAPGAASSSITELCLLTTPQNQVLALNAKTGDLLVALQEGTPEDLLQLHPTNRGVGLYEDKVYLATVDAHLVALDAKTGKVVWDTDRRRLQEGILLHPGTTGGKGKVMVGTSGGELGVRGFIASL